MLELDTIVCADALTWLATLPDASVDMVLCDLPYGDEKTKLSWDARLPTIDLWAAWKRIIKFRGAIALTATQPFTSHLILSNPDMFRYCWYWHKQRGANFGHVHYQPFRVIEDILIFSQAIASPNQFTELQDIMHYYPQTTPLEKIQTRADKSWHSKMLYPSKSSHVHNAKETVHVYDERQPRNLLYFPDDPDRGLHPTQKPVALFEYLIRTYTQPNEIVLDCCIGSGTTAVAARQCGRHFVGCDSDAGYVTLAQKRLRDTDPYQHREMANGAVQLSLIGGNPV